VNPKSCVGFFVYIHVAKTRYLAGIQTARFQLDDFDQVAEVVVLIAWFASSLAAVCRSAWYGVAVPR